MQKPLALKNILFEYKERKSSQAYINLKFQNQTSKGDEPYWYRRLGNLKEKYPVVQFWSVGMEIKPFKKREPACEARESGMV